MRLRKQLQTAVESWNLDPAPPENECDRTLRELCGRKGDGVLPAYGEAAQCEGCAAANSLAVLAGNCSMAEVVQRCARMDPPATPEACALPNDWQCAATCCNVTTVCAGCAACQSVKTGHCATCWENKCLPACKPCYYPPPPPLGPPPSPLLFREH